MLCLRSRSVNPHCRREREAAMVRLGRSHGGARGDTAGFGIAGMVQRSCPVGGLTTAEDDNIAAEAAAAEAAQNDAALFSIFSISLHGENRSPNLRRTLLMLLRRWRVMLLLYVCP